MQHQTVPQTTGVIATIRALLAAGWRNDSVHQMANGDTVRTMLHPSGREITASTGVYDVDTKLTLTGLTLDQVAGAITGAGLAPAGPTEPEHHHVGGTFGGPGENSAECACGVTYAGFDTHAEATALLDRHIADETRPAAPDDYWLTLADSVREAADRIATLAGTKTKPASVTLNILGSVLDRDAEQMVPLVDALAAAFDTTAAVSDERRDHHRATAQVGAVKFQAYTYVPEPEDPEKAAMRAELEQLRAQLAEGGAR